MASAQDKFKAAYEQTRVTEKELKQPDSNPSHPSYECAEIWPSREVGSQQTTDLAYNGAHSMAKRGRYRGGIWASIVRGCAAR